MSGQTPLPALERHWQRGEWKALAAWSDERLSEDPSDGAAQWFRLASSLLMGTASLQDVQVPPPDWRGEGTVWEANWNLVEGLRLQAQGRQAEALPWFEGYFSFGLKNQPARWIAERSQAQARLHATSPTQCVPLDPLELRAAPEGKAQLHFDLPDSIGRWVDVPEVLRSRHDRRADFVGSMFLRPGADRAWFASDLTGDGTTDLYEVELRPSGAFGSVRRLPEPINSPYNERTPVFESGSGRLYWSSDRPESHGHADVFWADLSSSTLELNQLPFALNSRGDETHFTPTGDGWTAWMVSRRLPDQATQLVRVLLDGPQHRPVQVELAWDWSEGERSLSIWSIDAKRMVWEGELSGASGVCRWVGVDGASYRALLTDAQGATYTRTEWTLPTTAAPALFRYRWEEVALAPVYVREEPWDGPEYLGPEWEAIDAPLAERSVPARPLGAGDLPEPWTELAETPWWRAATVHERWVAIKALRWKDEPMTMPQEPTDGGWNSVSKARTWTTEAMQPVIERLRSTTNALDVVCSAQNSQGWEAACAQWTERIVSDQQIVARGRGWQQLGDQAAGFARLRKGMPMPMKRAMGEIDWADDADQIMDRSLERAWSSASWEALLGTEEVWRDWLWAVWQAYRAEANPAESAELLEAWQHLEQSFELPVWANLSTAANALSDLILGPVPREEFSVPEKPTVHEEPLDAKAEPVALPAIIPAREPLDSVFAVQLGAFHDTPDGWAFWGIESDLSLMNIGGWKKVVYGSYLDRNLAIEACAMLRPFEAFSDAFVAGFSSEEWATARPWHELRMTGYGLRFAASRSEAADLESSWPSQFRAWPTTTDSIEVLLGPFWKEDRVWHAQTAIGNRGEGLSFPDERVLVRKQPVKSPRRTAPAAAPAEESVPSLWVVRIAECPLGTSPETRAALLRLPDKLGVRSVPWGQGDAYLTSEIQGEAEALRALELIQAAGFGEARISPVIRN